MSELILFVGLCLGTLTVTSYQSVPSQTDSSPNFTSIGDRTHRGGIAVSRDLLARWGGPLSYGDYLYVEGLGIYQVNDVMGDREHYRINTGHGTRVLYKKISRHVDIWVASRSEEHKIGVQHHKVFVITRKIK